MTTTNLSKYTWIALLVGAFLVACTQKAAAEDPTTPDNWQVALASVSIGTNGSETDITISTENGVTTYTVKTAVGLAWIAKVTNEGATKPETTPASQTNEEDTNEGTTDTNAQYYPSAAGFEGCIVKLDPTTSPTTTPASYSSLRNTSSEANTLDLSAHLWVPIGNSSSTSFKGTFEGNHKMITGLTVKVENTTTGAGTGTSAYAGLFGKLASTSKVSNLGIQVGTASNAAIQETGTSPTYEIEASSTSGYSYAGALAGYNEGTIENCFVSGTGTIYASSSGAAYSGGLIGGNGGNITHCYTTVKVVANSSSSSSSAGGITGNCFGQYFQIKNVYATGKVEATGTSDSNYAGGIVGYYSNNNGTLSNALALNKDGITGTINTNNTNKNYGVGRITGFIRKENDANLTACYASTKIRMNEKVKGESKYYNWQGNLNDTYHFIDGLTADTDTDLSTLFPTGTGAAWTSGESGCLPILAGFTDITQPQTAIADYLDAPLNLSPISQPQYSNTSGSSYTLTYSDTDGWTYTQGEATPATNTGTATSFSGRVKGTATAADLTVNYTEATTEVSSYTATTDDEATLSFADGTSWTAGDGKVALTISSGSKPIALFSEGTVTIKGNSGSGNSLSVADGATCRFASDNHFHLYGSITTNTNGTLRGLMQWGWTTVSSNPSSDISVFWTGGSTTIPVASSGNPYVCFATNPGGKDITVKLGDDYQKGHKEDESDVSTFNFDDNTNNAYVYYIEMGTSNTKGEKDNPYTVNLADPSTGASANGYTYSNTTITLSNPGSYYSLQGEVTAGNTLTLTLSATATNASTAAYHLLATSGSKADILKVPSGTNCTIEGTNTLTATAAQVEGNLTLDAPVTLARAVTSSDAAYCLLINNNGSVTVNSTLRVTATGSSGGLATAIRIGNSSSGTGTLTIGTDGQVYAYGTSNSCYLDEDAQLIVNGNGILRLAGGFVYNANKKNTPVISWAFGKANNTPITVKDAAGEVYATFSATEFGEDNFTAAQSFATNVKLNTDYTLHQTVNDKETQLSGVCLEDHKETQTFRTETGFGQYAYVGIPLSVNKTDEITLTAYNKYKEGNGAEQEFSGILSNCNLTSLTVDPAQGTTINEIVTESTTIGTLTVKGKGTTWYPNNTTVTSIAVESNGGLTIRYFAGTLNNVSSTTITNSGRFEDESGQISKVEGEASLEITSPRNATAPTGQAITLTATAVGAQEATVTGQWQKWNAKDNRWDNYPATPTQSSLQLRSSTQTLTFTTTVTEEGSYRCQVTCKKGEDGNAITTILTTKPATATFTSSGGDDDDDDDDNPGDGDYTPVLYTVTLPAVEGATTDPAAGTYEVEAWDSFRFYLTLDPAYDQSTPVVSTSNGETLEPRSSDGAYIVKYVRNDTDIRIDGIVKNTPDVGNEAIASDGVKVWAMGTQLHIHTIAPTDIYIYNFAGGLLKQFASLSGDKTVALPQGNYIVVAGKQMFKVQVK